MTKILNWHEKLYGHHAELFVHACLQSTIVTLSAGLSLGEYCALVFAGVLSFEDGLKVVKARGESMAAAATVGELITPVKLVTCQGFLQMFDLFAHSHSVTTSCTSLFLCMA